jgi:hypothetical protein
MRRRETKKLRREYESEDRQGESGGRKMIAGCRGGDEERENRNGKEGEAREKVQEERQIEKGMGRNMERRRQGDGRKTPEEERKYCNARSPRENPYMAKIKHVTRNSKALFFFVKTASLQPADKFELTE